MKMIIYQVTLEGFDASTDETDHFIKWIAVSGDIVKMKLSISELCVKYWGRKPIEVENLDISINDNGIDMIVTAQHVFIQNNIFFSSLLDERIILKARIKELEKQIETLLQIEEKDWE